MKPDDVRTGQAPPALSRSEFRERFMASYYDPAFDAEREAIDRLEAIAWDGYTNSRKSPRTQKAGPEFEDPDYDLSVEWYDTHLKLKAAQARWALPETKSRVLLVNCAARNDGSCPGEISKSWRLTQAAKKVLDEANIETDLLDLSRLTSDYRRSIHPCKACLSTAMPLCHWPCSCYPNHELNQVGDWMAEIYERWVSAHGVLIVTPVYWYQASSPLKLMMDRLVCADGGNPDPTRTQGKKAALAKAIEAKGWDYPKHLSGRAYGVVVHGDVAGIEGVRRSISDWLDWMGFIDAGPASRLDRYIGYYEPYWNSHETLDKDTAVQEEVRNAARGVAVAVKKLRAGELHNADEGLERPRPK